MVFVNEWFLTWMYFTKKGVYSISNMKMFILEFGTLRMVSASMAMFQ